jgi:hypothetical protein
MASTDINDLTLSMQELYHRFEFLMKKANISFKVTCTARTVAEQTALYAQGRKSLKETNALRMQARLPIITATENKKKVTWTMNSKHIVKDNTEKARAFDIVLLLEKKPHWDLDMDINNNGKSDYIEAAEIGKSIGLKPGAYFTKPDYPHYEEPNIA